MPPEEIHQGLLVHVPLAIDILNVEAPTRANIMLQKYRTKFLFLETALLENNCPFNLKATQLTTSRSGSNKLPVGRLEVQACPLVTSTKDNANVILDQSKDINLLNYSNRDFT